MIRKAAGIPRNSVDGKVDSRLMRSVGAVAARCAVLVSVLCGTHCSQTPQPSGNLPDNATSVRARGSDSAAEPFGEHPLSDEVSRTGPKRRVTPATASDADGSRAPARTVAQAAPRSPEIEHRPADMRSRHDDARAAELGIARYESRRLLLYTDIDPELARSLPQVMDQAYDAWTEYFGPLPPAVSGAEYQMTGYIMADRDRFIAAGMLPDEALVSLVHGIHRGSEFWMYQQDFDYYRRHLMIHEGTHCFMTVLPGVRPPVWYMEGMAEYFGTHRARPDGTLEFGVMPGDPSQFLGFGRVELVREAIAAGNFRSVQGVYDLVSDDFVASHKEPYAWSWAYCKFLDAHPRYRERFRTLAGHHVGPEFYRLLKSLFVEDMPLRVIEWELFARNLEYGFDVERAAIDFRRGEPLPAAASMACDVEAGQGWQSSGIRVDAGRSYVVTATGRISLADEPQPWISEPSGVSIRYDGGLPIGRLLAAVQSETPPGPDGEGALWRTTDVGPSATLTPDRDGTLYFRVNDFWGELSDNRGSYRVRIETPAP